MVELRGKGVCGGIAKGKVFFIKKASKEVEKRIIKDTLYETRKFEEAVEQAKDQLLKLVEKTGKTADRNLAMLFDIHQMMLSDSDFITDIENYIIQNEVCAEYAISHVANIYAESLRSMDNEYLKERAENVFGVERRLINILSNDSIDKIKESVIIAADDLLPIETLSMNRNNVLGFIIKKDTPKSHHSLFVKTMGIPTIINVQGFDDTINGKNAYIDGTDGKVYIDPDEGSKEALNKKQELH